MPAKCPLIAVVDDEDCVRRSIVRLLRSAAMTTQAYACGDDFLHDAAALQVDCVVLDLHMPRVSGFDVQALLERQGRRVPVVAITGHDSPQTRALALAGGACAYLPKPVDEALLLGAIANALARRGSNPTGATT
jgi:FixJ family two-component response regulator